MEILYTICFYYLLLGLGVTLATWLTELVMLPKSPPTLDSQKPNMTALLLGFMLTLWKWPVLFIGTAAAYLQGNTLLTTFAILDRAKAEAAKNIKMGLLPLRRRWQRVKNPHGDVFYSFISDYLMPNSVEHRPTHFVIHLKGQRVCAMRCMPGDLSHPPLGFFKGPQEAKWFCEHDTEWLNVASPLKDQEREALYKTIDPESGV